MKRYIFIIAVLFSGTMFCSAPAQVLNPGDGIRVIFYNITENITGDYFIQQDKNLQLPFLGLISTNNKDFIQLKDEIQTRYAELYRDPEITVQPLFRINILGEVKQPGFYYVTDVEKLTGIIALAGGETADADLDDLYIIRDNEEIQVDAEEIIKRGETAKDFGLQSGDRIFVPRQWWVGARNTAVIISGLAVLVTIVSLFVR
ncbi:MAG: polysaccharide biosynthesis/export family protein [Ignavibacteriaceae bacterium]